MYRIYNVHVNHTENDNGNVDNKLNYTDLILLYLMGKCGEFGLVRMKPFHYTGESGSGEKPNYTD